MTAQHTPGPWHVSGKATVNGVRGWICSVSTADRDANARLIAAAPELLEALQDLLVSIDALDRDQQSVSTVVYLRADAAIAKATGADQ